MIDVLSASESVQTIHCLKAKGSTAPYSASAMEDENDAIESFINSTYNNCNTDSCNDGLCRAAKRILGGSRECARRTAEKLLKFFCRISRTSMDFKYHLCSLQA